MKCGDCAFIPGTQASNSPNTLVIAHLCALTGEPFDCRLVPGPCAGWVEAVRARKISPLKPSASQLSIAATGKELMHHCERLALAEQEGLTPKNGMESEELDLAGGNANTLASSKVDREHTSPVSGAGQ